MQFPASIRSISFRGKLILIIASLIVGIGSAAVWQVQSLARANFHKRFEETVEPARRVIQKIIEERMNLLSNSTFQMGENPRLLAALSTDPGTVRDLIEDENERFNTSFRVHDGVLLYKREPGDSSRWEKCDRHGIHAEPEDIEKVLRQLDETFKHSDIAEWSGQIIFGSQDEPRIYIASACHIPDVDAILIFADLLDSKMAGILRTLTLGDDDHLVISIGDQVVASTLPLELEDEIERQSFASGKNDAMPLPGRIRERRLARDVYLSARDSLSRLGAPVLGGRANQGASFEMLKSKRELASEIASLNQSLLMVGGIGLLLAFTLASLVSMSLARPIQELVRFVSRFGEGYMERRLNLDNYHGEFARLAQAFDGMQVSLLEKNRRLIESERLYRTLIENSTQAISGLNVRTGRLFAGNRAFSQLTGFAEEALDDLTLVQCFFDSEAPQVSSILFDLEQEGMVSLESRFRRNDGAELFVDLKLSVVERSPEVTALVIVTDETERHKLKHQLIQSQKMESLGTLAGGVAHDFNNLLTAILGFTSLALQQTDPSDSRYNALVQVERAGERARELTQSLLSFGRRSDPRPRPINVNQIVDEVVQILSRTFKPQIDLVADLASALDVVEADPGQIQSLLMNLCINARDAMPNGGSLTIRTRNHFIPSATSRRDEDAIPGPCVRISISDTGMGMAEETRKRIFEPFFTTKEVGKGTGLGLSIVYGIVKAHKGIINVQSELDKGTTFVVDLPAVAKEQPQITPVNTDLRGGSEHILVVDDEDYVREFGREVFSRLGYSVETASSGNRALEFLKHDPDVSLVVLDLVMPEMSGRELFQRMRSFGYKGRTLIASGFSPHDSAKDLLEQGVDGFIQKPFRAEDIARKAREILDRDR